MVSLDRVAGALTSDAADRDLERRIVNFLTARHFPGLRQVQVEAARGTVTVSGQVKSFYEKQLCHQVCRRVAGVVRLVDDVSVAYSRPEVAVIA